LVSPFVIGLDHVQVSIPVGGEVVADGFYVDVLGFEILEKPDAMASHGGRWYGSGPVRVHLGVEEDFRPARKAHPALIIREFATLRERLSRAGVEIRENYEIPSVIRVHVSDPFGNRLELIDASSL
jgi:catechol 2,3-dioxygenase-like lactoylglutathione lyase family enzyme